MDFNVTRKEALILDPTNGMQPKTIPVEVRTDPLTGRTSRICHFMRLQWRNLIWLRLLPGPRPPAPSARTGC
jgi:hypothetical protein